MNEAQRPGCGAKASKGKLTQWLVSVNLIVAAKTNSVSDLRSCQRIVM